MKNLSKSHGNILIFLGAFHSLFGLTPWALGKTFYKFSDSFFFNINNGLSDFPLLGGTIQTDDFATFWFFYFGLALIPLGFLLKLFTKQTGYVPRDFVVVYIILVLIGAYMIPFSGMTIFLLPHALWMLKDSENISINNTAKETTSI